MKGTKTEKVKAVADGVSKIIDAATGIKDQKVQAQNVFQSKSKTGEKITTWIQPEPVGIKKSLNQKSKKHHNLVARVHDFPV
jgi:hypothetical protein